MRHKVSGPLSGLAVCVGLIAGCGSDGGDRPTTYPVTGVVKYKGNTIADAQVTFSPEGGGTAAFGLTDAEGRYTLTTFKSQDGAVAGKFKALVQKQEQVAKVEVPVPHEQYVPPGVISASEARKLPKPPANLIPPKFASADTSDLWVEVKEGSNEIPLDLKD